MSIQGLEVLKTNVNSKEIQYFNCNLKQERHEKSAAFNVVFNVVSVILSLQTVNYQSL